MRLASQLCGWILLEIHRACMCRRGQWHRYLRPWTDRDKVRGEPKQHQSCRLELDKSTIHRIASRGSLRVVVGFSPTRDPCISRSRRFRRSRPVKVGRVLKIVKIENLRFWTWKVVKNLNFSIRRIRTFKFYVKIDNTEFFSKKKEQND